FTLRTDGSWALSLGSAQNGDGKLEVTFNRNFDIDVHPANERFTLTQPLQFADSRAWVNELISRSAAYQDNLQYQLFPETQGGFNSNSYVAGLLQLTGTNVADPSTIFVTRGGQPGSYPGYSVPVPATEFGTGAAKRLDAILVVDTTSGMADDISAIKSSAADLVSQLDANFQLDGNTDVRIAVVDYRDFAVSPYGGSGDYTFQDVASFSSSPQFIDDAIQNLDIGDGGDFSDSVFSALMHSIEADSLGLWRGDGVRKAIFLVGDAPGHDPEPMTGFTQSTVDQAASDADHGSIDIFTVSIGTDSQTVDFFDDIAGNNRGMAFNAPTSADVVDALLAAFDAATYSAPVLQSLSTTAPVIDLAVDEGVTVSFSGSFFDVDPGDSFTAIVSWGDGTVEAANITSAGGQYTIDADYAYPRGGNYNVTLTLTDSAGYQVTDRVKAYVTGANAVGGRLNVVGTPSGDEVNIYPGAGGIFVTANFLPDTNRWFAASEVVSLGVYLGGGNDSVVIATALQLPSRIVGGAGHDGLFGGGGRDRISGGDENDIIEGHGGDDILEGNLGFDRLFGMQGNDILRGGNGDDFLYGGAGNDQLRGGNDIDHLYGDEGNDLLHGGDQIDYLFGNDGDDTLIGGNGDDQAWGHSGNDRLFGWFGIDLLFGGVGDDLLAGEEGDDELDGGDDWDVLFGGPGTDVLVNGEDNHP
ncbi:MAG: PKD domain-containing protein, partial [Pirellulaceae bacterium]